MIHVEHGRFPRPDGFDEAARKELAHRDVSVKRTKKAAWRAFNRYPGRYPQVREALSEIFSHKCVYCETPVTDRKSSTIDHFQPRNGARGHQEEGDARLTGAY